MEERWTPVSDWEDYYAVSTHGRVMRTAPGKKTYPGKILSPGFKAPGYLHVILCSGPRREQRTIHRMVAAAFLPLPEEPHRCFVAHKDNNPSNNCVDNLYWATPSENNYDQVLHGTAKGVPAPNRRPITDACVRAIRQDPRKAGLVAAEYGLSHATITQIRRRETHQHVERQEGDYEVTRPRRMFTPEDVRAIRRDARSIPEIARAYAVSEMTVWSIRTHRTYRWVDAQESQE